MWSLRLWLFLLLIALAGLLPSAWGQTFEEILARNEGRNPLGKLVRGDDGLFYGTTAEGGSSNSGTIFRVSASGEFTTLHSFNGRDGAAPVQKLTKGKDGNLYGATSTGGVNNQGVVFRVTTAGTFSVVYSFAGISPSGGLVLGNDGAFYGISKERGDLTSVIFRLTSEGDLTTFYLFGRDSSGLSPRPGGLIMGDDGNFYGVTWSGGVHHFGTLFRITPGGQLTTLHDFDDYTTGRYPYGLVQGSDGNIYGNTYTGGSRNAGTVFKVTPAGVHTNVYVFTQSGISNLLSEFARAEDGNIYAGRTH